MMNKKEKAFMKDLSALLKTYEITFYFWDDCGEDECILPSSYRFSDFDHFRIEIDDEIEYLNEEGKEEN